MNSLSKSIGQVNFPIWRIRKFQNLETNYWGKTTITTGRGRLVLDDTSIPGDLAVRRLRLRYKGNKLYPLYEQINTFRQLVKYPTKTIFIDSAGEIFRYKKTSKLNLVTSYPATPKRSGQTLAILVAGYPPFVIGGDIDEETIKYASIMETKQGSFLYDLTEEQHEPYKRKI